MESIKSIMLQGTASHVGKSLLVAALCRILSEEGLKVAPFKAQNMALNSSVACGGGEIGRAQAFQALCAGVEPTVDMNPILLKPTEDSSSQVIIQGKVWGNMSAREYHHFKKEAKRFVLESFYRLSELHDIIIIEGAGSPAEINLRDGDIVNMGLALEVDAPVIIIGDIDRGGVFASFVGTMELLAEAERDRVRGFIVNKFRGDKGLLKDGIDFLEKKTGRSVLGIIPYLKALNLPEEDGVALEAMSQGQGVSGKAVNMGVIKLPRISNFTDIDALCLESDVAITYIAGPEDLNDCDCIIIPGSKNTIGDMNFLLNSGLAEEIIDKAHKGAVIIGICGGFQMLGGVIEDPHHVESSQREIKGLGLLDIRTVIEKEKKCYQVEGVVMHAFAGEGERIRGYEIHMGETESNILPLSIIEKRNGFHVTIRDGAVSQDKRIMGTYIHGIFDNDPFRTAFLNKLRSIKETDEKGVIPFNECMEENINRLAQAVKDNLDMDRLYDIMCL